MNQRSNKKTALQWIPVLSFLSLASCATLSPKSISDVPTINVANVKTSPLKNIPQKTVSLNVMDNRDPQFRKDSEALQKEIRRVVTQVLQSHGVAVNSSSANALLVSVQDQTMGEYKDGCVKVNAMLSLPQVANLYSDATSCFEVKSPVSSVSMGSDINESYEMALSAVFQNLSNNLLKLQKTTPKK